MIHPSHEWPPGGFRCAICDARATSIEAMLLCNGLDPLTTAAEWEANMAAANEPVEIDWLEINRGFGP